MYRALTRISSASSTQDCVSCGWALCAIARATRRGHLVRSVVDMMVVFWAWWVRWWLWVSLKNFVPRRTRGRSQWSDFQCGQMCGVPDRDGRYFKVPGRCKTLIGSNEGSCTHDRWREGRQWYGEDRRATGRRRLGLRKRMVTKCRSARRSAETDQRTEDREHGAGIGSDDISGGLLKAERHQTARWRHQSMTSRNADLVAVGTQMVLGIGQQTHTRGWGQRTRHVGGAGARGGVGRGSQSWLGTECEGLGWLRQ